MDTLQANDPDLATTHGFEPDDTGSLYYEDRLDQAWCQVSSTPGQHMVRMDPLLILTGYGVGQPTEGHDTQARDLQTRFYIGQWDKTNNVQRHYGIDTAAARQIFHTDSLFLGTFAVPSYSDDNWRAAGIFERNGSGSATAEGFRPIGPINPGIVIFEEAEPSAGWDAGYAIFAGCSLREGGVDYDRVIGKVALNNGPAPADGALGRGIILPIPCHYATGGAHPTAHAGPLAGHDVVFNGIQFAPDPDSTLAAPKGRFFLFAHDGEDLQSHRDPPGGAGAATEYPKYVQIVEFNPTGKAPAVGEVSRVDNRLLLVTRCKFVENETLPNGGIGLGLATNDFDLRIQAAFYHPPTDTIVYPINTQTTAAEGNTTLVRFSIVPEVAKVTTPTAQNAVETGKVVTFGSTVEGD